MTNQYILVENYIKKFITNEAITTGTLEKLNIYILEKTLNHKQIWFTFKLTYDKFLSVTISYFSSYSKQKDKYIKLSPIGYIEKIITFLIFTELKNNIAPNTHKDFLINLALDINMPSLDTALIVKIDKRGTTTDIKCPICILNYSQFILEKVTLPCGHALCKTCLLKLFKSNIKTCPLCRKNILDDLEESNI